MIEEDLQAQFKEAIRENKYNFDQDYLNQLDLKITDLRKDPADSYLVACKVHNFNFNEIYEHETSGELKGFGKLLYQLVCVDSDLMRQDPKTAKLIDLAEEAAEEIAEKWRRKNRPLFYKIFPFLESERGYMGMCHVVWREQQKILKEKYNIDWQTPQERLPGAKFD